MNKTSPTGDLRAIQDSVIPAQGDRCEIPISVIPAQAGIPNLPSTLPLFYLIVLPSSHRTTSPFHEAMQKLRTYAQLSAGGNPSGNLVSKHRSRPKPADQ
jgi:hypothetical protein